MRLANRIAALAAQVLACSTMLLADNNRALAASYMDCGQAPLCGVLTLETGLGSGTYEHDAPSVHGLWPQVDNYGSSQCLRPQSEAPPKRLYSCYAGGGGADGQQIAFESYEWKKHGVCAGARDEGDFFGQVCSLSSGPLSVLAKERVAGTRDLAVYAGRVEAAGYPVFATDARNSQLELSACAGRDGRWILAKPSEFGARCAGAQATTNAQPASPSSAALQCMRNQKGPACTTDADCGYSGCVRCARSGFCTDQSLSPKVL